MSEQRAQSREEVGGDRSAQQARRQFNIRPGDMLNVIAPPGTDLAAEPLEPDDPYRAIGRRIARLDVEEEFATVYLTFEDGTYLTYASRFDEEGLILLDRFCDTPAPYSDYFVFEELEGESGPPPPEQAPAPGGPFHPDAWQGAVGRAIEDLGWNEEGMQVFIHFEGGGYLTLAARSARGSAYLLGYFSAEDPADAGGYLEFEPSEAAEDE